MTSLPVPTLHTDSRIGSEKVNLKALAHALKIYAYQHNWYSAGWVEALKVVLGGLQSVLEDNAGFAASSLVLEFILFLLW